MEGLRTDSLYLGSLRVSQLLSLVALAVCAALFVKRSDKKPASVAALAFSLAMAPLCLMGQTALALIPALGALICAGIAMLR